MPKNMPSALKHVHLNAAGIDVGSESHFVAVPADRDAETVREFAAFTCDLHALVNWLKECGIDTVVMESTGVYWIPLFELIEDEGIEVKLVDARNLKHVSARKSDVLDCQWLQQLHTYGLLNAAFRPDRQTAALRSYMRQRASHIQNASDHIRHMQKALDQMNIKLHKVVSDITGQTGMNILRAIVAGERSAKLLAKMRHNGCKNSEEMIAKSLEGTWQKEYLFELRQAIELYDFYQEKIRELDEAMEKLLVSFDDRGDADDYEPAPKNKQPRHNAPRFDLHKELHRISGVDLTGIDGVNTLTAITVLSEVGLDMTHWPTEGHFGSWLGLAPGTRITGGKKYRAINKRRPHRAAQALRLAARALHGSRSELGARHRKLRARIGPKSAMKATAYRLAKLIYRALRYGMKYVDIGEEGYAERFKEKAVQALKKRARALDYNVLPINEIESIAPVGVS